MSKSVINIYKELIQIYKSSEKIKFDKSMLFFPVYRHLSFPISSIFIWLGISANITTLIGFILLLCSFIIFIFFNVKFFSIALVLFLIAYILDFVDGNIARYHSNGNYFGKLIDGFVDYISYFIFIPLSIGNIKMGNNLLSDDYEIYLATATVFLAFIYMYFKIRIALFLFELKEVKKDLNLVDSGVANKKIDIKWLFSRVSENIMTMMPVMILIGFIANIISIVILFYFLYFSIFGLFEIIARLFIFYKQGNVSRSK
jgi:phosphatidylglycerophosphate synthase